VIGILRNPSYARLFAAQVVALAGTGLMTVALGLTAFEIAGEAAGAVLGVALTIKMLAYVGLSPVVTALVAGRDRRRVLVAADLVRAAAALCLPFVDAAWQIYLLIFVLQAASATFTPTFQAVIPDILPDEGDYTRALSLSRLAYDLENLLSPVLAGLLLAVISSHWLFAGTAAGFLFSAALVLMTAIPAVRAGSEHGFRARVTRGSRIYLATPRLRGLLALNVTVAFTGAVVIVLSVVIARGLYGGTAQALALALGAHGAGSMLAALTLPRLLEGRRDRPVMLAAGWTAAGAMTLAGGVTILAGWPPWPVFLVLWAVLGAATASILTPAGRLLRRSAHAEDRPAIFAAQFALSHACWLAAYPLAGLIGTGLGVPVAMAAMGAVALAGVIAAARAWPAGLPDEIEHWHDDLPPGHPHLRDAVRRGGHWVHRHAFVIDDEHRVWPTQG
jgi:hypothetical protein